MHTMRSISSAVAATAACVSQTFHNPNIPGLDLVSVSADVVSNWSMKIPLGSYVPRQAWNVTGLNFCNVSVISSHPGWGDRINTQLWLPLEDWNGRLQMTGGGGLITGLEYPAMSGALADRYASVSTDGGHNLLADLSSWAMYGPGAVNLYNLLDFGQNGLHEAAVMSKSLTANFYGRNASHSYFSGCSTGGRQGLTFAQNYPEDFDGIIAAAPAVKWNDLIIELFYPMINLQDNGGFPQQCELNALTAAAVKACDAKDGVADGIISAPELCDFDPFSLVGTSAPCGTGQINISRIAAIGAHGAWNVAEDNGKTLWQGSGQQSYLGGLMNTTTDASGVSEPVPFSPSSQWLAAVLKRDANYDWRGNYTVQQMYAQLKSAQNRLYYGFVGADYTDLSSFRDAGGKMITWHGMADGYIPTKRSQAYYDEVGSLDPNVTDYYRYFQVPGIGHCTGGPGPYPVDTLKTLVDWVEKGNAPDMLSGATALGDGPVYERPICLYPTRAQYIGNGDVADAKNWECK